MLEGCCHRGTRRHFESLSGGWAWALRAKGTHWSSYFCSFLTERNKFPVSERHLLVVLHSHLIERDKFSLCFVLDVYVMGRLSDGHLTWNRCLQLHYVKTRKQNLSVTIRKAFPPQTTGSPTLLNSSGGKAALPQAALDFPTTRGFYAPWPPKYSKDDIT